MKGGGQGFLQHLRVKRTLACVPWGWEGPATSLQADDLGIPLKIITGSGWRAQVCLPWCGAVSQRSGVARCWLLPSRSP